MERYNDEILDEIRSRNDIVSTISQYMTLKRKGRNYFGLCPFHNEKSPSFSVSPDKQIFHCFGCGVGGDVINFVKKIENIGFLDSVRLLAEKSGIQLPNDVSKAEEKNIKLKNRVYKINELAAKFYHENLYKPTSKIAQDYIKKRKLNNATLKSFLMGYASNSSNELLRYLKEQGFTEEELLASCLIGKSDRGYYDKFRNRLMIPIRDERGRFIAFGGRVLDDSKPKYINSPENIVYSKGRNLFGLNVAREGVHGPLKRLLIVEGYMDAISLYQRGITNVVASLGTALTDSQGRLLRRNTEQVILGYDADGAGQQAIIRGMEILKSMDIDIRILQISGAKDPDEYVLKFGPEKMVKAMDEAISAIEFKIKVLRANLDLNNVNDKVKFLTEIAKILSNVDNNIEREVYIDRISKVYEISKNAIVSEVDKLLYRSLAGVTKFEKSNIVLKDTQDSKIDVATRKREGMVVYLLIDYTKAAFEKIKNVVDLDLIKSEKNKKIIGILYERIDLNNLPENIISLFEDEDDINYVSGILSYDFEISDVNKAIEDIEKVYYKEKLISLRNELILKLENNNDAEEADKKEIENELTNVILELTKMK
ncbi:MAG: DNA primase [Clostridiales bacterium]|nr:DNA primase [Clostridiales bacterium]MBF0988691.1 DNA primase [Clostridiales bacterium]